MLRLIEEFFYYLFELVPDIAKIQLIKCIAFYYIKCFACELSPAFAIREHVIDVTEVIVLWNFYVDKIFELGQDVPNCTFSYEKYFIDRRSF